MRFLCGKSKSAFRNVARQATPIHHLSSNTDKPVEEKLRAYRTNARQALKNGEKLT